MTLFGAIFGSVGYNVPRYVDKSFKKQLLLYAVIAAISVRCRRANAATDISIRPALTQRYILPVVTAMHKQPWTVMFS